MTTDIIQLLDDTSINQIAAGEVIDRPSSVVKELVENSLDAGAHRIEIEILSGGVGRIRVTDDGCGMSAADVRMSVLRHATSKLRSAEELFSVSSMGFRGEALPSIASVAKFTLVSRQTEAELGTRLEIVGGELVEVSECGAEMGTVVVVSDLFFNTPARLKFMKSATAESSHVHEAVVKLSLARPDVTFRLINNGRTSLHTPGTGRLSDTLAALYGPEIAAQLFSLDHLEGDVRIRGFVGKPSVRKGSRQWQSFAVNRRVIGSRMLNRAIDAAYQTLLPVGSYPLVALHIEIPSAQVDVNVHPQKSEVKFQDERAVFRAVHAAIKGALSAPEHPAAAAAAFDHTAYRPQQQTTYVQESLGSQLQPMENNRWEKPESSPAPQTDPQSVERSYLQHLPAPENPMKTVSKTIQEQENPLPAPHSPRLQALAQFKQCYIIAADGESLYIIDQHAAHERILFDLLSQKQTPTAFQTLLIPLILDLDPLEVQSAENYSQELAELGFEFDWIGPASVRLSELPGHIPPREITALFRQILSAAMSYKIPDTESLRKLWIETAACHMAVRAGQSLNTQQMQGLLDDLMRNLRAYSCPHGRPTLIRITDQDLAKMFKRI